MAGIESGSVPKRWWVMLPLATAVDALFIATSFLHILSERGTNVGFRFDGWHVEDQFGVPAFWQVTKSGLVAVYLGVVCLHTRRWALLPWILALALIATSFATRFQDHIVGHPTIGAALVGVVLLALALTGAVLKPNAANANAVVAALAAFVISGGALDIVHDILLDAFVEPVLSIVEGGVELLLLTVVCVTVVFGTVAERVVAAGRLTR